jgi:hypothetical protein
MKFDSYEVFDSLVVIIIKSIIIIYTNYTIV